MKSRRWRRNAAFVPALFSMRVAGSQSELLEDRTLLSNLAITDAYLVDGEGSKIVSPVLGERLEMRAAYTSTGLSVSAAYAIRVVVDGVEVDRAGVTFGAGIGSGTWLAGVFHGYAEAGQHTVQILLDPLNEISEVDESDNSITFSMSPVAATNLPQKLNSFVTGKEGVDWRIINFADLDPRAGILRDYKGGQFTYDLDSGGHDAIDLAPDSFAASDEGIGIYAAADGVVASIHDGEYDRNTGFVDPAPLANYVIVDHGNGWQTKYWHLRRDSVSVRVGDVVTAGGFLGWMGSSGFSTGAHVHFALVYKNHQVESMLDPASYWTTPPGYPADYRHAINSGFSSQPPTASEWTERPEEMRFFTPGSRVYFWVIAGAMLPDDTRTIRFLRPDGSVFLEQTTTQGNTPFKASQWSYSANLPSSGAVGTWTASWLQNGIEMTRQTFTVSNTGAPEIRVEQGTRVIRDERFTPVNFGTAEANGQGPTQLFTIANQGSAPLTLGNVALPPGYRLVTTPAASVQPGQTTMLAVQMLATNSGYYGGELRMTTNDGDEPIFRVWLEGVVETTGTATLIPGLSVRNAAEGTRFFANVRRTGSTSAAVTVTLATNDTELIVPATVTIPAGSDFVNFEVEAVQDFSVDGDQRVQLLASAIGLTAGRNEILVTDILTGQFVITETNGQTLVRENGTADLFSIRLTAQPASPVIVRATIAGGAEISLSIMQWTFDANNWNIVQTGSVSAIDDVVEESVENFPITISVDVLASDPAFSSSPPIALNVTVEDDELRPTEIQGTSISFLGTPFTLSWSPVTNAVSYELWVNFVTGSVTRIVHTIQTSTSYAFAGFSEMGTYRVWVRATVSSGFTTRWSPFHDIRVVGQIALQPMPIYVNTGTPTFRWNAVSTAVQYDLRVDDVLNVRSQIIRETNLTATTFSVPSTLPMGLYRVWVRATDARGQSTAWSVRNEFYIATQPITTPTALSTFDRTPTLRWDAVNGARTYEIWIRNTLTGADIHPISRVSVPEWTASADLTSGSYRWWVRAFGDYGITGLWSPGRDLFVGGRPILQTPSIGANSKVTFNWSRVEGAFRFQLQIDRLDLPQKRIVREESLVGTLWQTPAALPKGTYRVWIQAVSTFDDLSDWSRAIDFIVA